MSQLLNQEIGITILHSYWEEIELKRIGKKKNSGTMWDSLSWRCHLDYFFQTQLEKKKKIYFFTLSSLYAVIMVISLRRSPASFSFSAVLGPLSLLTGICVLSQLSPLPEPSHSYCPKFSGGGPVHRVKIPVSSSH